mmetsp:Transcript_19615/g.42887  ORF Transcript_19615/g.42887 Transcript_19615/m.42887 type:complete len:541 (-) Transcript_19615:98-1720(-)
MQVQATQPRWEGRTDRALGSTPQQPVVGVQTMRSADGNCGFQQYAQVQQQLQPQPQPPPTPQSLSQQLRPAIQHILEVVLENDFEESTLAVTDFVATFRFKDDSTVLQYMPPHQPEAVLRGRILEAVAHWIRNKSRELDDIVQLYQTHWVQPFIRERTQACMRELRQACYQSSADEVLAEFIFSIVVELVGREAACLGSALGGMILRQYTREDLLRLVEWPPMLLSHLVRTLTDMQAKVAKVVMEMYRESRFLSLDDSKNQLMAFFQHYTVETNGTLDVHETAGELRFTQSAFRVTLVDSYGGLMKLLSHLERICTPNNEPEVALAVDFEGVKLCRDGALCLVQMTCSDDPTHVYVIDVHVLGKRAFTMGTPTGTSLQGVLEDQNVRKVWFDPRNDVDALYHQFGITPKGIFDLQLAEVANRRSRGLSVNYVQGLYKCLTQCPTLRSEQKVFAEKINHLGKGLFEPHNGGTYEIFQHRPLNPVILVYAAHDSRYMLMLYEQYLATIGQQWVNRVLLAGAERGRWYLYQDYVLPNVEAPQF